MKILVLGGYGTFGGRLAQLLACDARLTLLIAGRSLAKARAFVETHASTRASLVPIELDRDALLDETLRRLSPDVVVDASGPFQSYARAPTRWSRRACAIA